MATEFCQKCKRAHPDRVCDYDERGECAETGEVEDRVTTGTVAAPNVQDCSNIHRVED